MKYKEDFSFITSLALATGLMLSPESLVLLGNNTGIMGIYFLAAILFASIVLISTALCYGEIFSKFPSSTGEVLFIKEAIGSAAAIVFPICSRVVLTICMSTGVLVTAGFVFNEVFL